jgi:hypothetical protein
MIEVDIVKAESYIVYFIKGTYLYHREDGPAVERSNGGKEWWINGKRHREDGPAIISGGGYRMWYLDNEHYTKEEWFEALTPEQQKVMLFSEYFIN